jgi:hypothetical protein
MTDEYEMTVEVPVTVELDLSKSFYPNQSEPVRGKYGRIMDWVETAEPTQELKETVENALERDGVTVTEVWGATSFSMVKEGGGK